MDEEYATFTLFYAVLSLLQVSVKQALLEGDYGWLGKRCPEEPPGSVSLPFRTLGATGLRPQLLRKGPEKDEKVLKTA